MSEQSEDTSRYSFLEELELSVLKLSETVEERLSSARTYLSDVNQGLTDSTFDALEQVKEKQEELSRAISRMKEAIRADRS